MNQLEQQHRQDYLDWLYRCSGRGALSHPMHGLYTNLFQERIRQLITADMERIRQ
jgi:hypothetical protein